MAMFEKYMHQYAHLLRKNPSPTIQKQDKVSGYPLAPTPDS